MAGERRGGPVGAGEVEADPLARFEPREVEELIDLSEGWPLRCALVLQKAASVQRGERAARLCRRAVPVGNRQPPRSPRPCSNGCRGWAVFESCRGLEIQRCDECWAGVPGERMDDDYQRHPVCRAALRAAMKRSNVS